MDIIPNRMGAFIYGVVSVTLKRAFSFTLGTKAPSSLLGVAKTMYEALLFFTEHWPFMVFNQRLCFTQ
jgi:hypothetical protein